MSPRPRRRSALPTLGSRATVRVGRPRLRGVAWLLAGLMAVSLAACGAAFDPTGPCTTDGSAAGAYPDLEAVVPKVFRGGPPSQVDSGRTCTPDGLGTLAAHGVKEVRFAGATWSTGNESGVSLAIFADPSGTTLDPAWIAEFYEAGAKTGKNVTSVEASDYSLGGDVAARRLDVLNGESYQTVIIWAREGNVAAAVVANAIREIQTKEAHDEVVRAAVEAYAVGG